MNSSWHLDPKQLQDWVAFGQAFEILPGRRISYPPADISLPGLYDGRLDDSDWMLYSKIMPISKPLDGSLARDILANPGIYVVIRSYATEGTDNEYGEYGPRMTGWVVALRYQVQ